MRSRLSGVLAQPVVHAASFLGTAIIIAACDLPFYSASGDFAAELRHRKGVLESVEERPVSDDGNATLVDVQLVSSTGLHVSGRLRLPAAAAPTAQRPAAILVAGRVSGRTGVNFLPRDIEPVVFAVDYPAILGHRRMRDRLDEPDMAAAAAWDVPAMLMLAADYVSILPEVDSQRIALIGVSFGGFFAPVTAAVDERFANLALLYAGGNLHQLVEANVTEMPAAALRFGSELAVLPYQRFEPTRYLPQITPRHVLIVNGLHDDQIPRANAQALADAARPPREMVWLPTGHLRTADTLLIRELVDTAFVRLPVLRPAATEPDT